MKAIFLSVILFAVLAASAFSICRAADNAASDAEKLFNTKCSLCHSIDRPKYQRKTKEEWRKTVSRMMQHAPVLTPEQGKIIVDYLAEHYGK